MVINMLELTDDMIITLKETAKNLKGSNRRMFMARIVNHLGYGGSVLASKKLDWHRETIRKGQFELKNGAIKDKFSDRGRKKIEELLPNLLYDIKKIVEPESQTDPSFNTCRLFTRLTSGEVRRQLLNLGYTDNELPSERTIRIKLNDLGYNLKKVQKSKPKKKF